MPETQIGGRVQLWRAIWLALLVVILTLPAMYATLPTDGATGDLDSFLPEGFRVGWIIQQRPGGLQAGDIITRVDGLPYQQRLDGDAPRVRWQTGRTVDYTIIRNNETISLSVSLRPLPFNALVMHWGFPFLSAIGFVLVGSLVFWRRQNYPAAQWFMLWAMSNAAQMVGDAWNFQYAILTRPTLFWWQLLNEHLSYGLLFTAALMQAFVFPRPRRFVSGREAPIVAALLIIFWGTIFGAFWLSPQRWQMGLQASNVASVSMAGVYMVIITGFYVNSFHKASNAIERSQVKWLLYVAAMVVLVGVPFHYLPIILNGQPLLSQRITSAMTIAMPLAFAVAILEVNLYEIDIIINRTLVYGTASGLLVGLLALSLTLVNYMWSLVSGEHTPIAIIAALSALCGLVFRPARRVVQRFVDRKFYGIGLDYEALAEQNAVLEQPLADLPEQARFGPYRDLRYIGRGGSAQVYKAVHASTGQPVAIKMLPPIAVRNLNYRRRFEREATIVASLEHPNIVRLLDFGQAQGTYFMVMEYVHGYNLSHYLARSGPLPVVDIRRIVNDIASALDYAHAQGMVHRDIKPSNVILEHAQPGMPFGRAVLADFGIAQVNSEETRLTMTGVMGTFEYIAPEQIEATEKVTSCADIYSLGIMTYELMAGRLPFKNTSLGATLISHLLHPPPDPRTFRPELPESAAAAVLKALEKSPDKRFPTAGAFAQALNAQS